MTVHRFESLLERRFSAGVAAVFLIGFFLRVLWLPSQPPSVDDFSVAITAINYTESGQMGPTMWNHPALRNILVYLSMKAFGAGMIGVKGWSLLFGSLSVPLMALVGRRLTGSAVAGIFAALLWATEPLAIDFSRQGINDIYLAFFPLLGIWCGLKYHDDRGRPWWLIASGVSFGLGLASKWSALFQMSVMAGLLLHDCFKRRSGIANDFLPRSLFICSSLFVLPLVVYLLTFFPWFGRGYGIAEWPTLQKAMYRETKLHTGYQKSIEGDHVAADWFLKPVVYQEMFFVQPDRVQDEAQALVEDNMIMLAAVANPLVWLLVLPSVAYVGARGFRKKDRMLVFLTALFLMSYLPFAVAHRPIWVNTAVAVLPYAFLCLGCALWLLCRAGKGGRSLFCVYVTLVIGINGVLYFSAVGRGERIPVLENYLLEKYTSRRSDR